MGIGLYCFIAVLVIGFLIFFVSLLNYALGFSIFLAIFPLIYKVPVVDSYEYLPAYRIIIFLLFVISLPKIIHYWHDMPAKAIIYSYCFYVLILMISALFSQMPLETFARTLTYFIPLMFFFCAFITLIDDRKGLNYMFTGILIAFVLTSLYGLIEIFLQRNILVDLGMITQDNDWISEIRLGFGRITSFLGQPVYTALYLLFTIPVIFFIIQYFINSLFTKLTMLMFLMISIICIIFTGARTGLIGIVLLMFVYLLLCQAKLNLTKLLCITLVILGFIYIMAPKGILSYYMASLDINQQIEESHNLIGRLQITYEMMNIAKKHILLGLGPGFIFKMRATEGIFYEVGGMENQYAALLADSGLLGLFTFLLFLFIVVKVTKTIRLSANVFVKSWANVVLSILIVLILTSISYGYITEIIFHIVMVFIGIEIGLYYIDLEDQPVRCLSLSDTAISC
jgi:hypothetical protein